MNKNMNVITPQPTEQDPALHAKQAPVSIEMQDEETRSFFQMLREVKEYFFSLTPLEEIEARWASADGKNTPQQTDPVTKR